MLYSGASFDMMPPAVNDYSNTKLGGIPKRPKGADCKSAVTDFEGSNPSPTTIQLYSPPSLSTTPIKRFNTLECDFDL